MILHKGMFHYQVLAQNSGIGISFAPSISRIDCEYQINDPTNLKLTANVSDDGPQSQLRFYWRFCKYCGTIFERTNDFSDKYSNPTFMRAYSSQSTSGTLFLQVTDGNGLGSTSTRHLDITPGSCN